MWFIERLLNRFNGLLLGYNNGTPEKPFKRFRIF
jgi:hypothetical protein